MMESNNKNYELGRLTFLTHNDKVLNSNSQDYAYKILIVDDDENVHKVTRLSLRSLKFQGHTVSLIDAYSMKEAMEILDEQEDIALVLLDVVMESEDAGLQLAKYIREELDNHEIRIIIRTGYPGIAPEDSVMIDYDINDYRSKTDLTATNLNSSVLGCLRNYRDIMKIDSYKKGLERVIDSTGNLFDYDKLGLTNLLNGILEQLLVIINSSHSIVFSNRHFDNGRLKAHDKDCLVIAATGMYKDYLNRRYQDIKEELGLAHLDIEYGAEHKVEKIDEAHHYYVGYHKPSIKNHTESYIFIINGNITEENEGFINLFLKNMSFSLDNYLLEQDGDDAIYEMLFRMASILEARDGDTGNHVHRVSEISGIIGREAGIDTKSINYFKIASMLHDLGKIGIRDNVLLKPGKLTDEEFTYMKEHTSIGYNLLKESKHQLIQMTAQIAYGHHERWDGTGYPRGLSGFDIPLVARIVSVSDVFDALSHDRVYRKAWSIADSKAYILDNSSTMFDPEIVRIFQDQFEEILEIMEKYVE